MDEQEFSSVLDLFPRVRSASYCEEEIDVSEKDRTLEEDPSSSSSSGLVNNVVQGTGRNYEKDDLFWVRLKTAVEKKLSPADSARFCDAFRQAHQSLVHQVLSSEAYGKILEAWNPRHKQ